MYEYVTINYPQFLGPEYVYAACMCFVLLLNTVPTFVIQSIENFSSLHLNYSLPFISSHVFFPFGKVHLY